MITADRVTTLKGFHADHPSAVPGEPMPLYHGTDAEFSEFQVSVRGLYGSGVYLTPYSGNAQEYGHKVLKVYAAIAAPLLGTGAQIRAMREQGESDAEFTARLQMFGYDGIVLLDAWGDPETVLAFEAEQVSIAGPTSCDITAGSQSWH